MESQSDNEFFDSFKVNYFVFSYRPLARKSIDTGKLRKSVFGEHSTCHEKPGDWLSGEFLSMQIPKENYIHYIHLSYRPGDSFTKQLSKNLGLSSSLSVKFTLIPYPKILTLNLSYFMKLAPVHFSVFTNRNDTFQ